jgi:hypothetical protein
VNIPEVHFVSDHESARVWISRRSYPKSKPFVSRDAATIHTRATNEGTLLETRNGVGLIVGPLADNRWDWASLSVRRSRHCAPRDVASAVCSAGSKTTGWPSRSSIEYRRDVYRRRCSATFAQRGVSGWTCECREILADAREFVARFDSEQTSYSPLVAAAPERLPL